MEINYAIVIPVILLILVLVAWLIWRNSKDEKKFEKDVNQSEIKPEQHDKDKI
ncbi:MAG: hypothetical protein V4594_09645 [Bacteroidota bacterium]